MRRGKDLADGFGSELRFWLDNLAGHGRSIAERTVGCGDAAEQAAEFSYVFTALGQRLERLKGLRRLEVFLTEFREAAADFMSYQSLLIKEKLAGRLGDGLPTGVLLHIYREGECCQAALSGYDLQRQRRSVSLSELSLWLRSTAEHTTLLRNFCEPAECRLRQVFAEYEREWQTLTAEFAQLAEVIVKHSREPEQAVAFAADIRAELGELVKSCRLLCELKGSGRPVSLLSVHELEHLRSEGEHFMYLLSLISRGGLTVEREETADELTVAAWPAAADTVAAVDDAASAEVTEEVKLTLEEGKRDGAEPVVAVLTVPEVAATKEAISAGESEQPSAATPVKAKRLPPTLQMPRQAAAACPTAQLMKKTAKNDTVNKVDKSDKVDKVDKNEQTGQTEKHDKGGKTEKIGTRIRPLGAK